MSGDIRMGDDYEDLARRLGGSPDHRVLHRLTPRQAVHQPDGTPTKLALYLDVETTGLDPAKDEIIELAMVPFSFSHEGRIFEIGEAFSGLREPSVPISPEITRLTGIDAAMVAGRSIDPDAVRRFAAPAVLVIAHNAAFDRPFVEQLCDVFATKAWACSMSQVPWSDEGFEGTKLGYLAMKLGFFFTGHRAEDDCRAAIEILARPLPISGGPALAWLLDTARRPTFRVWAENAPFALKHLLKARRYRWSDGSDGQPRAWFCEVAEAALETELKFLREEIYRREIDPVIRRINAYDRFSNRV